MSTEAMSLIDRLQREAAAWDAGSGDVARLLREAAAALIAQPPADPALWQYRWTNPGDQARLYPDDMAWKEVEPNNMQTLAQRIDELRAFRYNDKPVYEVRPLYAGSQPPALTAATWTPAPASTEWGADMMVADVSLSADETLTMYATRAGVALIGQPPAPSVPAASWGVADHLRFASTIAPPPVRERLTDSEIDALLPKADGTAEANRVRVEVQPGAFGVEYDEVDAWSLPLVRQAVRAAIERATGEAQ